MSKKPCHSVIKKKKKHEHLLRFFNKRTFHLLWHERFYVAQYFFKLIAYSNYINTFKKNYQDIYINFRSNPSD